MHLKLDGTATGQNLQTAIGYINDAIKLLRQQSVSFLCGDAGPLAVGAVLYDRNNQTKRSRKCIERYVSTNSVSYSLYTAFKLLFLLYLLLM